MYNNIDLVIPSIPSDIGVLLSNLDCFFSFLPINNIIVIGPLALKKELPLNEKIKYYNEEDIIDCSRLKEVVKERQKKCKNNIRLGWYLQQFIKMSYSKQCNEDYYLLWDSDTVPLKKVCLFDNEEKPVFHIKTEYHKPYFDVIEKLIPGLRKQINGSFIAEHMLIKTDYMRSLIKEIESNANLKGDTFEEKIINTIDVNELYDCGFSEFETYGSYVQYKYFNEYSFQKWSSLRFGGFFFSFNELKKSDVEWLSRIYDAISFEKKHKLSLLHNLTKSYFYKKVFSAKTLDNLSVVLRLKLRLIKMFKIGNVKENNK